jgi:hypothetical protein
MGSIIGSGFTSSGGCRARRRASVCDSDSLGVSGRVDGIASAFVARRRLDGGGGDIDADGA